MKNMKKFLAVVLALVMMIGAVSTASAANFTDVPEDHDYVAAIEQLHALKLIEGNGDGTFAPDKTITRAEAVKMIYVYVLGTTAKGEVKDATLFTGESVFGDVTTADWFCGYVNWAAAYGIVNGVGQELFNPNAEVKLSELVKMVYLADEVFGGANLNAANYVAPSYPYGYISKADSKGLFENLELTGVSTKATRGEAAQMLANLLAANANLDRFAHVKAIKGVYNGWTNANFTAAINTANKVQMQIGATLYETALDLTDLPFGANVVAYQDTQTSKIVLVSDNTVDAIETTVAGITKANNKYYANGAEIKLDTTVTVYEQKNTGYYAVSALTVDELTAKVDDAAVTLVVNNGKVNVVLVKYMQHYVKYSGYNSLLGTVTVGGIASVKVANVKGVDVTVASTAEYNMTVASPVRGVATYTLAAMNKLADVKITKLDKLNGYYTEVYAGADLYKYASDFTGAAYIEKLSTSEGTTVKNTVNLWLDTLGNIIKWEAVAAPGSTTANPTENYAFVAGLTVEEVVGTWSTELVYTVTLNNVDGTTSTYKLTDLSNTAWFGHATNKGGVVTKVVNNATVPAINGAFVKYTYTPASSAVTAIAAEDTTAWATVDFAYNKAYTGLVNLDGEFKAISTIKAVVYNGTIITVDEFITLCGDKKELADVPAVAYKGGKLLIVGKFQAATAPATTSSAYAIITGASVAAGETAGTFRYTVTGTFNGVTGTYYSVDFDSNATGLNFTMNKLSVVNFENGKIKSLAAVDTANYKNYVFTAVNGALYSFRAADLAANKVSGTVEYVDLQTNVKEIIVYKTTKIADKGMTGDQTDFTVATFADFAALLSTVEGTVCAANPFAMKVETDAQGKKTITIVILAKDAGTYTVQ